ARFGGGLYSAGTLTLLNSTVADNRAHKGGGGIFISDGSAAITNCTVASNRAESGGGIDATRGAERRLANTIVAGNDAETGTDIFGAVTADYCLFSDTGGATITGNNNLTSRQPNLHRLDNYGGPTATIALLPGSPAINGGANSLV